MGRSEESVSPAAARDTYGVVLNPDGSPDTSATRERRAELRRQRLARARRPAGLAPRRLEGPVRLQATENLAVRTHEGQARFTCAGCATDLGPVEENYKEACAREDAPIERANALIGDPARYIDARPVFRQLFCPGCGRLVENEVALADEPLLRDIELRL